MEPQHDDLSITPSTNGWSVTGEIDAATAQQLADAFANLPDVDDGAVEVDLARVTFIDSSGLRVLLGLADRAEASGRAVVIRNASRPVSKLLAVTQLESRFGLI